MRIVMVGINYWPELTGVALYTTGMASALQARGHSVTVIAGQPHYPQWRRHPGYDGRALTEFVDGVRVLRMPHSIPESPSLRRRARMEMDFGRAALGPANSAVIASADAVVCISPALVSSAMVIARLATRRHRPPTGLWMQDLYCRAAAETGATGSLGESIIRRVESAAARSVDGVLVIHDRIADVVSRTLDVPPERITVVRNWCHLPAERVVSDRHASRAALGWPDDGRALAVHAGNMGAKQALTNVVSAAAQAHSRGLPLDVVLVGDGGQRRLIEDLAAGLPNLRIVDPLPDSMFGHALAAADVLIVNEAPGVAEMAVPSKLTSYFNSGRPVVAATSAGSVTAAEVAAAGAGRRVDPDDPVALLRAITELAADPAECERHADSARRFTRDNLDMTAAVEHFECWLHDLAGAHEVAVPAMGATT